METQKWTTSGSKSRRRGSWSLLWSQSNCAIEEKMAGMFQYLQKYASNALSLPNRHWISFTHNSQWNSLLWMFIGTQIHLRPQVELISIGYLYNSRKYMNLFDKLYLYKSQSKPKIEYWCHICADQSPFSSLEFTIFSTLQTLSHRCNFVRQSHLYRYFHDSDLDKLHSFSFTSSDLYS